MAEGKAEASRYAKVTAMSDAIPFEQTLSNASRTILFGRVSSSGKPAQVHRLQRALGFQPWITSQLGHHRRRARPPLWQSSFAGTFPALDVLRGTSVRTIQPSLG